MANTVDIAPSVGHALVATQLGTGASPGYDAIDLRRATTVGFQEGVIDAAAWKVAEHSPNGMTVDVAANVGRAMVQGDNVTAQGLYAVAPHNAVVTLDIASNASGNPRLDQIILQAYDQTYDGSGQNKGTVMVLAGSGAVGATLDNRSGAAALPNNALRLADVLVASGTATITNSVIRDRRRWAKGASFRGIRTQGDIALTQTWVEVGTGQLKTRLECSGNLMLCTFWGTVECTDVRAEPYVGLYLDGTNPDGSNSGLMWNAPQLSTLDAPQLTAQFSGVVKPSAGSHLFSVWGAKFQGVTTLWASPETPAVFSVNELVGQDGSKTNGIT